MALTSTIHPLWQSAATEAPLKIQGETDGRGVAFRRAFIKDNQHYDLVLWKLNSRGMLIPIDEKSPLSSIDVGAIIKIAGEKIFAHYPRPSEIQIVYRKTPEQCYSCNVVDKTEVDFIKQPHRPIIEGTRGIYKILTKHSVQWSRDDSLLIYPKRVASLPVFTPDSTPAKDEIGEEVLEEPVFSAAKPSSVKDAGTETTALNPSHSVKDASTETDPDPVSRLTSLSKEVSAKKIPGDLYKILDEEKIDGCTYSELERYAKEPTKEPHLQRVYNTFKAILRDPSIEIDEAMQERMKKMRQWMKNWCWKAYLYLKTRDDFLDEEFCKHFAASIVSFIRVDGLSVQGLIAQLAEQLSFKN